MISILAAIALFSFPAFPLEAVITEPFELRVTRIESRINRTRHGVSARAQTIGTIHAEVGPRIG